MDKNELPPKPDFTEFSDFAERVIPSLIHRLILEEKIPHDQLENPVEIIRIILENLDTFTEFRFIYMLHEEFANAAKEAFDKGNLEVGTVLLATAIEQIINSFYRESLASKRMFDDDEITEIIRSNNIAPKTTWLLALVSEYDLGDDLRKRIANLMELRNQIIHYKATPIVSTDEKPEFHSMLRKRLKSVNLDEWLSLPEELFEALEEAQEFTEEKEHPEFATARKVVEDYLRKAKDKNSSK